VLPEGWIVSFHDGREVMSYAKISDTDLENIPFVK
jgi:hypothetical protein